MIVGGNLLVDTLLHVFLSIFSTDFSGFFYALISFGFMFSFLKR